MLSPARLRRAAAEPILFRGSRSMLRSANDRWSRSCYEAASPQSGICENGPFRPPNGQLFPAIPLWNSEPEPSIEHMTGGRQQRRRGSGSSGAENAFLLSQAAASDHLRTLKQRVARPQGIRWRQHLECISRQAVDFKTCQKALLLINEDTAQVGFISEEKICNNVETTCLIRCAYDGQIYGRAAAAAPPIRS